MVFINFFSYKINLIQYIWFQIFVLKFNIQSIYLYSMIIKLIFDCLGLRIFRRESRLIFYGYTKMVLAGIIILKVQSIQTHVKLYQNLSIIFF